MNTCEELKFRQGWTPEQKIDHSAGVVYRSEKKGRTFAPAPALNRSTGQKRLIRP
jgi:hypothetical protein